MPFEVFANLGSIGVILSMSITLLFLVVLVYLIVLLISSQNPEKYEAYTEHTYTRRLGQEIVDIQEIIKDLIRDNEEVQKLIIDDAESVVIGLARKYDISPAYIRHTVYVYRDENMPSTMKRAESLS